MEGHGHARQTGQPDRSDKQLRAQQVFAQALLFHFQIPQSFALTTFAVTCNSTYTLKLQKHKALDRNRPDARRP